MALGATIEKMNDKPFELRILASRAKNREEFDFEVRFPLEAPKPAQKAKNNSETEKSREQIFCPSKIELMGIA